MYCHLVSVVQVIEEKLKLFLSIYMKRDTSPIRRNALSCSTAVALLVDHQCIFFFFFLLYSLALNLYSTLFLCMSQ